MGSRLLDWLFGEAMAIYDDRTGVGTSVSGQPFTLARLRMLVDDTRHWSGDSLVELTADHPSIRIHRAGVDRE